MIAKFILMTTFYCAFVTCKLQNFANRSPHFFEDSLTFVSKLIRDCNEKYPDKSDIVIFHDEDKEKFVNEIIERIPKSNAVVNSDPNDCFKSRISGRKSFVFIVSSSINQVNCLVLLETHQKFTTKLFKPNNTKLKLLAITEWFDEKTSTLHDCDFLAASFNEIHFSTDSRIVWKWYEGCLWVNKIS